MASATGMMRSQRRCVIDSEACVLTGFPRCVESLLNFLFHAGGLSDLTWQRLPFRSGHWNAQTLSMPAALEVLFTPAEFAALRDRDLSETVCVVFDVLRATSTMVTALGHGATASRECCSRASGTAGAFPPAWPKALNLTWEIPRANSRPKKCGARPS